MRSPPLQSKIPAGTRRAALMAMLIVAALSAVPGEKPEIELFTPQGTVKQVRQVRVRFGQPMIPFGRFREAAPKPFEITCPEEGSERWVDSTNWVYDFKRDLPAGVRCVFKVNEKVRTLSGLEIHGQKTYTFSTGGPSITSSDPYDGSEIAEDQVFILTLDAPVDESSVKKNARFRIEGIRDVVEAVLITGTERDDLLKSVYGRQRQDEKHERVLLRSKLHFPAAARVDLLWGQGIQSQSGVATDLERKLTFRAQRPLVATFNCDRENERAGCIPILPMRVDFSAPIKRELAEKIVVRAGGRVIKPALAENQKKSEFVSSVSFPPPFPEHADISVELPGDIRDEAGRRLSNASQFPVKFKTEDFPPLAKFAARFGIIEAKAGALLPVTLRNLEGVVPAKVMQIGGEKAGLFDRFTDALKPAAGTATVQGRKIRLTSDNAKDVMRWLSLVQKTERDASVFSTLNTFLVADFKLAKPNGARAFEVVPIGLPQPGLYIIEIESRILGLSLLGESKSMYVPTAALVTNMAVHFKAGRESSLAWVTSLDRGAPVKNAKISVRDCKGVVHAGGVTDENGIARLPGLSGEKGSRCSYQQYESGLLVTAETDGDFTFAHTSWKDGIETWRFNLPYGGSRNRTSAHTVFDRTLFRAGETVHMKHIMRLPYSGGLRYANPAVLPPLCRITHLGTNQKFDVNLKWDPIGVAQAVWTIPKAAKLGEYSVELRRDAKSYESQPTGSFKVEEFRIPLMKAVLSTPAEPVVGKDTFPVDLAVSYLSGGGAGSMQVRLKSQVQKSSYFRSFADYEEFSFSAGSVKEGTQRRTQRYYYYYDSDEGSGGEDQEDESQSDGMEGAAKSQDLTLDPTGSARASVGGLPQSAEPYNVLTELEYPDPNGEVQTISRTTPVWPSQYVVGIKPDAWILSVDNMKFHVAVLGLKGQPVAGANVAVDVYARKTYSHRKRLVGGFYAYESVTETKRAGEVCSGKTDAKGLLLCDGKPPGKGNLILEARAKDPAGRWSRTVRDIYVAGKDDWWQDANSSDRMDVLPEKKHYEPGDRARLQVRVPFQKATALITVEREGLLDTYVQALNGPEGFVEVPIRGSYAPNVFVSVLAIRGRVAEPQPTALVDLGRPTFKLGLAEINVGSKAHELKVKVVPDRETYKVRDKAQVAIEVLQTNGKPAPRGSEVAVAAVDQGLLELAPNHSWDLLAAMMGRRPYEVETVTAQMQVVGRRHFGRKALPPGGGGGKQITREMFDTLLLWKGRVFLDDQGRAKVEIPLNDSLTAFRITAVATAGEAQFGTGNALIRTTQDLMLLAGLPPVSREGDAYKANYTMRNTTSRSMNITLTTKITGLPQQPEPITLQIGPGESKQVGWDIAIPYGVSSLVHEVQAKESGNTLESLRVTTQVLPAVPVRTFQATLLQLDGKWTNPIQMPLEAIPGRGGIQVELRPSLLSGVSGVRDAMARYPYTCLEQQVSVAVALRDTSRWERVMTVIDVYLDGSGLAKYFPLLREGSDVLTSYILALSNEAGWEIPSHARNRMTSALTNFVEGRLVRGSELPTADLTIRKLSAMEALSRYGLMKPSQLESISIDPNHWPTSSVIDWFMILGRVPTIPSRDTRMREAETILRSRLNFQGTTMNFSQEADDRLWWLMVSSDVNAVRLLLSTIDAPAWREDLPRLVRGVMARQRRGAWDLTLANAWGVLAVEKFAKAFESGPVQGTTTTALAGATKTLDWKQKSGGDVISFTWPSSMSDLSMEHKGSGKPWVLLKSTAAIPLKTAFAGGYSIEKTVTAVERKSFFAWTKGDVIRVKLKVNAQSDMTWVVINDPIPGGASILGGGLARDSAMSTQGERQSGYAWPAFTERAFDGFRAYYQYVGKGDFSIEYTVRLNQSGTFQLPPTRVEAMYSPEMFGELPNEEMKIGDGT